MTLITNAKIYSLNNNNDIFNNILISEGIIIKINIDNIEQYNIKEVIDLKGNYLFPGFSDAHIHLIGYGRKLHGNKIQRTNNKTTILNEIRSLYQNKKLLIESYFDIGLINEDLDLISTEDIIILRHNDYHSFTVNSKVLELIDNLNSNGIITDEELCKRIVPYWQANTKEELLEYTISAIKQLHRYGITTVHTEDLSYFNSYNETLDILNEASLLYPINIKTLIHHNVYEEYLKNHPNYKHIKDIQIKLFYDGTLSSKTALLRDNYKNTLINGNRMFDSFQLEELIKKIRNNNHAIAVHTIGDLALEEVIALIKKYPNNSKLKDRIIHASLANKELIEQLSKMDVALDIQPLFIKTDLDYISKNINHDVLVYPFKEYNNKNILINSSSDAPVESANPLEAMYYLNDINRLDVIKSFTYNPSTTISEKNGIISIGTKADFTVFDNDILKINRESLLTTKVYATIINGKLVYLKG